MIITSLLDTDLYKFTMMQVVLHHFPAAQVEYRFKCRTPDVPLVSIIESVREELQQLCSLRFRPRELEYLRGLRFIKSDFVDFLGLFQLNTKYVTIEPAQAGGDGEIEIVVRGPWLHTILFEIPLLAIVNELWFQNSQRWPDYEEGRQRLEAKIRLITQEPDLGGWLITGPAVDSPGSGRRKSCSRCAAPWAPILPARAMCFTP